MPRVGRAPLAPVLATRAVQRRFTHRGFLKGADSVKMKSITSRGGRLEQLKELAKVLAAAIDACIDPKALPAMAKQYRETIREIEEI